MKLLLLLLFPLAWMGQSDTPYIKKGMTLLLSGSTTSLTMPQEKLDTARVMIVYADTTSTIIFGNKYYSQLCGWQFGYKVTSKHWAGNYLISNGGS